MLLALLWSRIFSQEKEALQDQGNYLNQKKDARVSTN